MLELTDALQSNQLRQEQTGYVGRAYCTSFVGIMGSNPSCSRLNGVFSGFLFAAAKKYLSINNLNFANKNWSWW